MSGEFEFPWMVCQYYVLSRITYNLLIFRILTSPYLFCEGLYLPEYLRRKLEQVRTLHSSTCPSLSNPSLVPKVVPVSYCCAVSVCHPFVLRRSRTICHVQLTAVLNFPQRKGHQVLGGRYRREVDQPFPFPFPCQEISS